MNKEKIIERLVKQLSNNEITIEEINVDSQTGEIIIGGNREICLTGKKTITIKLLNENQYNDFLIKKSSFNY